jgi:hypothetical protein
MGCLQRKIWFASHCAILVLALGGCGPWASPQPGDRAPGPVASEAACMNWNAYDEDWHRRHCDVAIRWCNGGAGGSTIAIETSGAAGAQWNNGAAGKTGSTTGGAGATGAEGTAGVTGSTTGAAGGAGTTGAGAGGARADAGLGGAGASASSDAGVAADGGPSIADAGQASDGGGGMSCAASPTCPQGTSCVAGSCQACGGGVCTCQRDDDCSAGQICDHDTNTCAMPPPVCATLSTEADCAKRADCAPVYGGMSCTNTAGSPCHSGEANCTCATYSFAACVARD